MLAIVVIIALPMIARPALIGDTFLFLRTDPSTNGIIHSTACWLKPLKTFNCSKRDMENTSYRMGDAIKFRLDSKNRHWSLLSELLSREYSCRVL